MVKKSTTIAAILVASGMGLVLAGMMTSSIMKVCVNVSARPRSLFRISSDEKSGSGFDICANQGIFMLSFILPEGTLYLPTPLEKQNVVIRAVAGLLMLGGVGCILSALFFTMSACNADSNNKEKATFITAKWNMIATIIQLLSVVLLLSGMSIYTNLQVKTIGNPKDFTAHIIHVFTGLERTFSSNPRIGPPSNFAPPLPLIMGRSPPDIAALLNTSDAQTNFFKTLFNHSREKNQGLYSNEKTKEKSINDKIMQPTTKAPKFKSLTPPQRGVQRPAKESQPMITHIRNGGPVINNIGSNDLRKLKNLILTLGYSFYFLWGGCALQCIAFIVGVANWKRTFAKRAENSPTN